MALIIQFEAHIPHDSEYISDLRPWWVNPSLWRNAFLADSITRPTEDAALKFIEDESRAMRHRHRYGAMLTPEEKQLLRLEHECLRRNTALVYPLERAAWVASQIGGEWNARGVKLALEEISSVIVEAERDHVIEVVRKWDQRVIERRERDRMERVIAQAA